MMLSKKEKINNKIEQSKDISKRKKVLKYVLNGLLWAIILGFLFYSGLRMIDVKVGYTLLPTHSAVIVSHSMEKVDESNYDYLDKDTPHIYVNDVVHTVNYGSFDDVTLLDVIIYLDSNGNLICHRVIDKYINNGVQYVVTRGDANNIDDAPVRYDLVRGRVYSVTGGGQFVRFLQSEYFVLALCGAGFFILLGYLIYSINNDKKSKNKEMIDKKGDKNEK